MKRNFYILVFLCFISLGTTSLLAQENTNVKSYKANQFVQLNLNEDALLVLENTIATPSNIHSHINYVKLNQKGNNNQIDLKLRSNDNQTVNQLGENNYFQFINYYNSSPSNFNIVQQGKANNLQIYGENSIIRNISIIQKSNFKTLIIKNY